MKLTNVSKLHQKGLASILILVILVLGLLAGLYLVQQTQIFKSKAFVSGPIHRICAQVITPAKNSQTGECREFPTPCDVPFGWQRVGSCDIEEGFEIGLEAGAQSDTSRVDLVAQSGAKWVRLNFIEQDSWGSGDTSTYNNIINAYLARGIKIIGLIGAESVPGGYDRNNASSFTDRFVDTADTIVTKFGDRVKVYELFNEPNDWLGGSSAQVPADYFAQYLERVYRQIKITKRRGDIRLISGPLFSFDDATGADYLEQVYVAGRADGWEKIRSQTGSYPLDGIGYHFYVVQGSGDVYDLAEVESKINQNLSAIEAVINRQDPAKKIWISEFGWGTGPGRETEAVQAAKLTRAFSVLRSHYSVRMAMWFTLLDFDETEWGLVKTDGTRKKAWTAFLSIRSPL